MQAYQLDEAQRPAAQAAAREFMEGLRRIDAGQQDRLETLQEGSAESYDYRIRAARAQIAGLRVLAASLTPAQQERLRTQTLREFRILDESSYKVLESAPKDREK